MNNIQARVMMALSLAGALLSGLLLFGRSETLSANMAEVRQAPQSDLAVGPDRQRAANSVLTTTVKDFFLPGTQPNQLTDIILAPADCDVCHTAPIYDRWRGSMMSQASRDPVIWAALAFANNDAPGAGE